MSPIWRQDGNAMISRGFYREFQPITRFSGSYA